MALKGEAEIDEFIEEQLGLIHEQIEAIDNHKIVRAAEKLLEKKKRLQQAERVLMGHGSKTTDGGGRGVTKGQVIEAFPVPGALLSVQEIADHLRTTESVVRGHLNRGKDESFVKTPGGLWGRRDPEKGFNTADDFDESVDDD